MIVNEGKRYLNLCLLGLMDLTGLNGEVIVSDFGKKLIHSEDLRFRFGLLYVKLAQFIRETYA